MIYELEVKTRLDNMDLREVRIIPQGTGYTVEIVYENQIDQMKQWCFMNGYTIHAIYADIASGISFEKRKGFFDVETLA